MPVIQEATNRWSTLIEEAVHVLRLFKPGQAWITGAVYFTPGVGTYHGLPIPHASAYATPFAADYELSASEAPALKTLWTSVRSVRARRIQPALRRFGFAGDRIRSEDKLIDLVIAGEAIFLAGETQESAYKLALRSAVMLGGIEGNPSEIFRNMKRAYHARSKIAHGAAPPSLKFADGQPASLDDYVELVARYMRATLKILLEAAAKNEALPMEKGTS